MASGTTDVINILKLEKACKSKKMDVKIAVADIRSSAILEKRSYYDAARYAWKNKEDKIKKVKFVLAKINGIIVDVFEAEKWLKASYKNFGLLYRKKDEGRFGFIGYRADKAICDLVIGKKLPKKYRKQNQRYIYSEG